MKTRDKQMRFIFKCEGEARRAYEQAYTIAATYGRVTLADICDLIGTIPSYGDTKIYWTTTRFIADVTVHTNADDEWVIHISDYLSDETCDDTEETEDTEDNADDTHPVYINVTTSDMDDPDCILCSVFKHARELRDRDVFINVY